MILNGYIHAVQNESDFLYCIIIYNKKNQLFIKMCFWFFCCFTLILGIGFAQNYPNINCRPDEFLLGDVCVDKCPKGYLPYNDHQRCIKEIEKIFNSPNLPDTCKDESIPGMFFSWVVYDKKQGKIGTEWGERFGDNRLKGCGEWEISQLFYHFSSIQKKDNDEITTVPKSEKVKGGFDFNMYNHRQFVLFAENKKAGTVLIVFRGTEDNIADWLDDLEMQKIDCPFTEHGLDCGKIHEGFFRSYEMVRDVVQLQAKQYLDQGYNIIFNGHSQGSATSSFAALELVNKYPTLSNRISLNMFASPRIGNKQFVKAIEQNIPKARRFSSKFEHTFDIVTTIPIAEIGYDHIPSNIVLKCDPVHFKNPNSIRGIDIGYAIPFTPKWMIPLTVGCHYQEVYMDGLLEYYK